jgi:hypothetical protein
VARRLAGEFSAADCHGQLCPEEEDMMETRFRLTVNASTLLGIGHERQ